MTGWSLSKGELSPRSLSHKASSSLVRHLQPFAVPLKQPPGLGVELPVLKQDLVAPGPGPLGMNGRLWLMRTGSSLLVPALFAFPPETGPLRNL